MADTNPNIIVSMPSQLFTLARSFKAAANGSIYIGAIDTDPLIPANQIQVYVANEDGTFTAVAQPIKINVAGYPVYAGEIAKFVTESAQSMKVMDSFGVQQFYFPNVLKYDPDQLRLQLSQPGGAAMIGTTQGDTVQDEINSINTSLTFIGSSSGYLNIGRCATIAVLRTINPTIDKGMVSVVEHTAAGGIGGGFFQYDASDTTTADDNGWFIVTNSGKRFKRILDNYSEINLADYGLLPGGALDGPLSNAVATASRLGITSIKVPITPPSNPYILTGGLSFAYPVAGLNISGESGTYNGVNISHTGNNTGITWTRGTGATLFSRVRMEFLRVIGNAGDSANFVEFQDCWRCGLTTCWISLYTLGAACIFHNVIQWTENPYCIDLMSRSNKYGILHVRTASSGGTNSFYGADYQISHQFAVANSAAVAMPTLADATNACLIYGAKIDVMGWYEGQGGHNAMLVGNYQKFLDSDLMVRTDGSGGITDGTDLRALNASGLNSVVDVYMRCNFQQGGYTDVSALTPGSSLGGFGQALTGVNLYTTVNGRNIMRARGARYKWQLTSAADLAFNITNLPCYSSFRAILTTKGTNAERSSTFLINTHGFNNLAEVARLDTFTGAGGTSFTLTPFGGGTGGAFSAGNGGKITWNHLAATFGQSVAVTLEIEMQ